MSIRDSSFIMKIECVREAIEWLDVHDKSLAHHIRTVLRYERERERKREKEREREREREKEGERERKRERARRN